jgi:hypothetical protein
MTYTFVKPDLYASGKRPTDRATKSILTGLNDFCPRAVEPEIDQACRAKADGERLDLQRRVSRAPIVGRNEQRAKAGLVPARSDKLGRQFTSSTRAAFG